MEEKTLTVFVILAIYLGFAGVWGSLLHATRRHPWSPVLFGVLLFLPASLGLPWKGDLRLASWGLAVAVVIIYALQPKTVPQLFWERRFALGYFSLVLLLIIIWLGIYETAAIGMALGTPAMLGLALGLVRLLRANDASLKLDDNSSG